MTTPLFSLGTVVATPGVNDLVQSGGYGDSRPLSRLLKRHLCGDWAGRATDPTMYGSVGMLDDHDLEVNRSALVGGGRILTVWEATGPWVGLPPRKTAEGVEIRQNGDRIDTITIWIITEADRSATTFLLPSEY